MVHGVYDLENLMNSEFIKNIKNIIYSFFPIIGWSSEDSPFEPSVF